MGKFSSEYWSYRRVQDRMGMLIPLVILSDFERLSYDEEFTLVRSLPDYMRNEFDEKGRRILGIYRIAGDDDSGMYFFHTWSPKFKDCSAAFMLDFRKAKDIRKRSRSWYCLNPDIPAVSIALGLCSEMAHEAEGENKGHPIEL